MLLQALLRLKLEEACFDEEVADNIQIIVVCLELIQLFLLFFLILQYLYFL